jgi:replicative DNA helicase
MTAEPIRSLDNQRAKRARPEHGDWTPPHNTEAEYGIVGCMLRNADARTWAVEYLTAESFYSDAVRPVFEAVRDLTLAGGAVDLIIVLEHLRLSGDLANIGGGTVLHDMDATPPLHANFEAYGQAVRETARERKLLDDLLIALYAAKQPGTDHVALAQRLAGQLQDLARTDANVTEKRGEALIA